MRAHRTRMLHIDPATREKFKYYLAESRQFVYEIEIKFGALLYRVSSELNKLAAGS